MEEQLLDSVNWRSEAAAVASDIEKHVKFVSIGDGNDRLIHLNLTTIEGDDYCVELSANGFRIVGKNHNTKNIDSEEYFETPYSMLNKISPKYQCSFGNELIKKLNNLQ